MSKKGGVYSLLKINKNIIEQMKDNIETFNINDSLNRAKQQFDNYYDIKSVKETVSFDEEVWVFRDLIQEKPIYFNFQKFNELVTFNTKIKKTEFLLALKCWTIFNLNYSSPSFSFNQLNNLYSICLFTKGFSSNFEQLVELIESQHIYSKVNSQSNVYITKAATPETVKRFANSLIDFNNFYSNLHCEQNIINNLTEVTKNLKVSRVSRNMPKPKEFLIFKDCLNQLYLDSIQYSEDKEELIKFFPLIIWWDLTSIIPLRPSEFCLIQRNCINGDKITFPRLKQRRNKKETREEIVYDTLPIPKDLIHKIKQYIELTNPYSKSEKLISFQSLIEVSLKNVKSTVDYSNKSFTIDYLRKLIEHFYKDIIIDRYQFKVEEKINPGDLRHVAIISMMLQGYDRVEIERLAGHFGPEQQFSYMNHMHFLVDTEIQTLANQFVFHDQKSYISPTAIGKFSEIYDKIIYTNHLINDESNHNYIELDLGYCMDKTMSCPTFNWNHTGCYQCKNWTISETELQDNREFIINELSYFHDDLHRKVNYLAGLYNIMNLHEFGEIHHDLKSELKIKSKEIEDSKAIITRVAYLLGREHH